MLHAPHSLSQGERELIATYVSSLNECNYCRTVHGYTAGAHLGDEAVACATRDPESAPVSGKMKALLAIAAKVQKDGKLVSAEDVQRARSLGATDLEIHDTVLIAAAFCMYNRYVDGLAAWDPKDEKIYRQVANRVIEVGYTQPGWQRPFGKAEP